MKVIFLDHDGVICLSDQWGGRFKKKGFDSNPETPLDTRMDNFDAKAVKVLNSIIEETGCEIVTSSDWKRWGNLEQMQEMYTTRGIKPPIALTPDLKWFDQDMFHRLYFSNNFEQIRVFEINEYLRNHPEVTQWVAIDDMDLSELANFIHCKKSYTEGIKQSGLKDKILKFLKDDK
jgi:hypothetical protein